MATFNFQFNGRDDFPPNRVHGKCFFSEPEFLKAIAFHS